MEKRFVKDYAPDETGQGYIYKGKNYGTNVPPALKKKAAAFAALEAVLFIGMFLTGDAPTRMFYVGIPFALLIIFIPLYCYEAARFYRLPEVMERRHYEGAFNHIGVYAGINIILSAAVCVTFAVWAARAGNVLAHEFLFPIFSFAIAVVSVLFFKSWVGLQNKINRP